MTQEAIALRTTGGAYPGLSVVQDVNKALATIATDFAGAADPAALAGPYMTWADTGNMLLKRRNAAGAAWVVEGPLLSYGSAALPFKAAPSVADDDVVVQSQLNNVAIQSSAEIATTSGTQIDVTGIPATAKRVVVCFDGISLNGADNILVQLGDAGGVENSGYYSLGSAIPNAGTANVVGALNGFLLYVAAAANAVTGMLVFEKMAGNKWIGNGGYVFDNVAFIGTATGKKTLSDTLTTVRLTSVSGTSSFDAGKITVSWEG